jgi:hypothetical protein
MKDLSFKPLLISVLLLFFILPVSGQRHHNVRFWKATIFFQQGKIKGQLYNVTDSSVILLGRDNRPDETLFSQINKIRIVPQNGKSEKRILGFFIGGGLGAWSITTLLNKGRQGGPVAMAGVVGGIGGFVLGGSAGIAAGPGIYNFFAAKRFHIVHDPAFYPLLKTKLKPYSIKGQ